VRHRRSAALLTLLAALSLVAAACGKSSNKATSTTTSSTEKAVKGGTLVLGAEQEPDCADWIASCAGASWGTYMLGAQTMPRAFDLTPDAKSVPSSLLTGDPTLDQGPPMKITYHINPKAVWSDGSPITSTDFKYTWQQITTGNDIYDKTGYKDIQTVDDSDPKTVVVTFKNAYASWRDLFGGFYGVYPSKLLPADEKARDAAMKDGYKWSGGPWMLDHWTKGQEIALVPNPNYWGDKPNLDKVVFKIITDTAAESQAYKTGQIAMFYPQAQLELAQLKTQPDTKFDVTTSLSYEALWFNAQKPPLDDKNVRQALAYATDRDAIVNSLFGQIQPGIKAINGFVTPGNKEWYTDPFKIYTPTQSKVDELMKASGYAKGSDGMWAKGGKPVTLQISTTAGNKRRELTEQLLQSQWKTAGFTLTTNNTKAGTLFGEWGPQGVFQISLYAQVPPSTDPGICSTFCSENIPTKDNPSGQNWTRLASPAIDEPWKAVDKELDQSKRKDEVDKGQAALAAELPGLPIDPFPDVLIYNSAKLHGPIDHNFAFGPFVNMNDWWCTGGTC
jgi:peptide/nickel transport system substrate-binding protein